MQQRHIIDGALSDLWPYVPDIESLGQKGLVYLSNDIVKNAIFMSMSNLGQFCEKKN